MSDSDRETTVSVEATREGPTETTVRARSFELTVDEPEAMGGNDAGPTPLEYLLAAQAGCLNVTGQQIAGDMGIEIRDLTIDIEGAFDVETFQTPQTDEPTGLRDIRVTMTVDADADEETIREWADRVEARCPVSDNLTRETAVSVSAEVQ